MFNLLDFDSRKSIGSKTEVSTKIEGFGQLSLKMFVCSLGNTVGVEIRK